MREIAKKEIILKKLDLLAENKEYEKLYEELLTLLEKYPEEGELHVRIGNLLIYTQSRKKAIYHLERAVELMPWEEKAWTTLAYAHERGMELQRAKEVLEAGLEKAEETGLILLALVELHRRKREPAEALEYLRELLRRYPEHIEHLAHGAEIYREYGRKAEALDLYEGIIREDQTRMSPAMWMSWYELMSEMDRGEIALEKLRLHTSIDPDNYDLRRLYAQAALDNYRFDEARLVLENLYHEDAKDAKTLQRLSHFYEVMGDLERASKYARKALEIEPEDAGMIYHYIQGEKIHCDSEAMRTLNYALASLDNLDVGERIRLHYAAGKALDDLGDYAASIQHYVRGGMLRLENRMVETKSLQEWTETVITHYSRDSLIERYGEGSYSRRPLFIVGLPRSGTTLTEQILSRLPGIYGAGELRYFAAALHGLKLNGQKTPLTTVPFEPFTKQAGFGERAEYYLAKIAALAPNDAVRIVDKMPGNAIWLGLIDAIFPQASIVYVRRHPIEIALSAFRVLFAKGHYWSYDLKETGRYIRTTMELRRVWLDHLPEGRVFELFYENLVEDPEGESKHLAEYVGVAWTPEVLQFYKSNKPVFTASIQQVRQPLYRSSTDRWKRYEKYLEPLLDGLGDEVDRYEEERSDAWSRNH